jgi:hypothetical protein
VSLALLFGVGAFTFLVFVSVVLLTYAAANISWGTLARPPRCACF